MQVRTNAFDQPIGPAMPDWTARARPPRTPITGQYCRLEPLQADRHAADLYDAFSAAPDGRDWTYMASGPFDGAASYLAHATKIAATDDPLQHAVIDLRTGRAIGSLSLMRIDPANGTIEVGHVAFSPSLKRTRAATEAQYLLMCRAFDELGYRRYEWKCDSLNGPSRAAAARLGFQYEGIFRNAVVYNGRSRDTAWFAMTDQDWPVVRAAFEQWLSPANFNEKGEQREGLSAIRAKAGTVCA